MIGIDTWQTHCSRIYHAFIGHHTGCLMGMNNLNPFSNHNVTPQRKGSSQGRKNILISHGDKGLKANKENQVDKKNRGRRRVIGERNSYEAVGVECCLGSVPLKVNAFIDHPRPNHKKPQHVHNSRPLADQEGIEHLFGFHRNS
jgi:hypothetical protein